MTILTVIAHKKNASQLVAWSKIFADLDDDFEYICLEHGDHKSSSDSLPKLIADLNGEDKHQVTSVSGSTPVSEIIEHLKRNKPRLLITDHFSFKTIADSPSEKQNAEELVRSAPCTTIYPLSTLIDPGQVNQLLMIVNQSGQDMSTLRISHHLAEELGAPLTLATVEDKSTSKAEVAGEMAIQTLIHDYGLERDAIKSKVAVDNLRNRGLRNCLDQEELVVCGYDGYRDICSMRRSLSGKMVMIVKPSTPLKITAVSDWLPKINPRSHAELLQNLRQGSRWNGDFVSMLSLAAAIASLGLLQDSPAVVIGSMLLAPLMTPMIGAGLALAQANITLFSRCAKTIGLGILTALTISLLIGLLTPSRETLSPQVLSRGSPNVLDLLIALGAAVAATIAMSRPNIAGAVAGVAIATALVPPLCAVGISLSAFRFDNALGASLLFTTNLIAIIVAASVTFSLMGIVSGTSNPRHLRLTNRLRISLVALLIILAGPLTLFLYSQLEKGRPQPGIYPVTRAVSRALQARVDNDPGVEIVLLGRSSVAEGVFIYIASKQEVPKMYANELRTIVRKEMGSKDLDVYVICLNGQWLSKSDLLE